MSSPGGKTSFKFFGEENEEKDPKNRFSFSGGLGQGPVAKKGPFPFSETDEKVDLTEEGAGRRRKRRRRRRRRRSGHCVLSPSPLSGTVCTAVEEKGGILGPGEVCY